MLREAWPWRARSAICAARPQLSTSATAAILELSLWLQLHFVPLVCAIDDFLPIRELSMV